MISIYIDQAIMRRYFIEIAMPTGEDGQPRVDKISEAKPEVLKALKILEQQLGSTLFLCGDTLTLADALIIPILDYLRKVPDAFQLLGQSSPLMEYTQRLSQRASCAKALS